jgi:hypothetical protein
MFAVKNYPKLLKKGGMLCIEDIPDETWVAKFGKALPPGYKMTFLDLRSAKGRWDDMMLVIEHS